VFSEHGVPPPLRGSKNQRFLDSPVFYENGTPRAAVGGSLFRRKRRQEKRSQRLLFSSSRFLAKRSEKKTGPPGLQWGGAFFSDRFAKRRQATPFGLAFGKFSCMPVLNSRVFYGNRSLAFFLSLKLKKKIISLKMLFFYSLVSYAHSNAVKKI